MHPGSQKMEQKSSQNPDARGIESINTRKPWYRYPATRENSRASGYRYPYSLVL